MTKTNSFEWLKEIASKLATAKKRRKNLLDIAGFPRWETVNSNILAFYFDEQEEHNFKRLFMDSLLELVKEKEPFKTLDATVFDTPYQVERETNRIDILLRGIGQGDVSPWAIIIENKIDHILANPLDYYWSSVNAEKKLGIVLNLHPLSEPAIIDLDGEQIQFANVTHKQLMERVQQNLGAYFAEADDRHLLLLKEYFSNIQSHYDMEQPDQAIEQNMKAIHQYQEEIKQLESITWAAKCYVVNRVGRVMESYEFKASNWYLAGWKHYYKEVDGQKLPLRIYIDLQQPVFENKLSAALEFYDQHTDIGTEVFKRIEEQGWYDKAPAGLTKDDRNGGGWYHIAIIWDFIENKDNDFEAAIKRALNPFFGIIENGKSFFDLALETTQQVLSEKEKSA
ncbi:MAG: PD-(D/E)XK nuclease family protein [Saprospiraceae bacterium]